MTRHHLDLLILFLAVVTCTVSFRPQSGGTQRAQAWTVISMAANVMLIAAVSLCLFRVVA